MTTPPATSRAETSFYRVGEAEQSAHHPAYLRSLCRRDPPLASSQPVMREACSAPHLRIVALCITLATQSWRVMLAL